MKIAYLAPEIPALSATFVYNEMLALQELGYQILPISVHKPQHEVSDLQLADIKRRVLHLYATSKFSVLFSNVLMLLRHPLGYLQALRLLTRDMFRLGLLTRSGIGLVYRFFYAGHLARFLERNKAKHLHVHFAHVPTDIAMYATRMIGIGFSVTAHANDIFERGWLLPEKVERSLFFATISEFNKRYLIEQQKVDAKKVEVVRCGVDTLQFKPKPFISMKSPVTIGVLGRLVEKKGIDTLIEAMALLDKQGIDFNLKIAGSGPLEIMLKEMVDRFDLNKRILFLGALPHTEVPEFLASLDLFVLPCKQDANGDMDGIPVVLMEAMMLGVPVISTELTGIPELVINHVTGLLTKPGDAKGLAQAIKQLCSDQELQKCISLKALEKVEQEFSQMINAQRLDKLFKPLA